LNLPIAIQHNDEHLTLCKIVNDDEKINGKDGASFPPSHLQFASWSTVHAEVINEKAQDQVV